MMRGVFGCLTVVHSLCTPPGVHAINSGLWLTRSDRYSPVEEVPYCADGIGRGIEKQDELVHGL